jgi:hypothetical protein
MRANLNAGGAVGSVRAWNRTSHDPLLCPIITYFNVLARDLYPRNRVAQLYPHALGSLFFASYDSQGYEWSIRNSLHKGVGRLVKLLLVFVSTVIPGFSVLETRDEDLYSHLVIHMFRNWASSPTKEVSVSPRGHYVCCTVVSARVSVLSRRSCYYGLCAPFVTALY